MSGIEPDVIIETGTLAGGTSAYYTDILANVQPRGRGDVPSPVENQRRLSEVIFSDRTFLNTF